MKRIFVSFLLIVLILANTIQVSFATAFEKKESQTLIASTTSSAKFETIQWKKEVDPYNGVLDLAEIKLGEDDFIGFDILKDGKRVDEDYKVAKTKFIFKTELELNSNYSLRVITNEHKFEIKFKTNGLPVIYETGERIIVKVPAMPEKGFNWPYYLAIPSNQYKQENKDFKRYLLVDGPNTNGSNLEDFEKWVKDTLTNRGEYSVEVAEKLWTPMLMPAFPRTGSSYKNNGERNTFYEHALDRDIATLHNKLEDPNLRKQLEDAFEKEGYDVDKFSNLDEQLVAMFEHAVEYLNEYGHQVETDKMFLTGYSATGTFTDRFTALHPDKVKAVASGGTLDDMFLPMAEYKNEKLIFPLGTYDYKEITGESFNLAYHNNVARLVYMGKDDQNNTLPNGDTFGDTERNIMTRLWGVPVLPRAVAKIELYGKSGGKGIFILDKGIKHSYSKDVREYLIEFFKANRNSNNPVYPIPKNPEQLQYTLFK
ncbi:hypothetical protein [Ureibacillus acetophenoni]|uniref:Uncharacterized protein n=1 Tax=Ureibacillus acetophenoni TaxID=614649 RepID=A0A285TZ20_9BACL|nr:hypothetical protein [Ureibacillus acetophenoni]SOC34829.1 hypothetical protein SAMN05877842_101117 [Ureibacillus acetophenoni]